MFRHITLRDRVRQSESEVRQIKTETQTLEPLRKATQKLIRVDEINADELAEMVGIYDEYQAGKEYHVGDVFQWQEKLYKVLQSHTSQEDWTPDSTPALYLDLLPENVIPGWQQPAGGHDAYNKGDKVIYNGVVYKSVIYGNVWSPSDYPQGWEEV